MMTKTYAIKTFGCQMNTSDSERIAQVLEGVGFRPAEKSGDIIVVNTCSIREKAENKAHGFIENQKKANPKALIAVTGCMVQKTGSKQNSKDKLLQNNNIDIVFRIEDTMKLGKIFEPFFPTEISSEDLNIGEGTLEHYFQIVPKVTNSAQVFVPIMQGCDKFCTYCIVPYTRGRESSRDMDEIFNECQKLVKQGAKEITLLGQNVNSYRQNDEKIFAKLLQKIDTLHVEGLSRLRFTSSHPQDFTDDVIEALAEMKTACPYIHLPVQHGSNNVLKKMNRNYTIEKYEDIIKKIREKIPQSTIATDIIVGFPGESDKDFKELCAFAERIKFDFSYTAIFSPRPNTPAHRMTDIFIDNNEKKNRFHAFDDIIKKHAFTHRAEYIGKSQEVLVEKSTPQEDGGFKNIGRSREFFEVEFISSQPRLRKEVSVSITDQKGYILKGKL